MSNRTARRLLRRTRAHLRVAAAMLRFRRSQWQRSAAERRVLQARAEALAALPGALAQLADSSREG
jgi:hypothetical protein